LGQLNYQDNGGGGDTGRWYNAQRDAALITSALFATAGTLALLAPNPTEKRIRLDTVTLHKTFMGIAAAGFAAEIVLGFVAASREGKISQRDLALATPDRRLRDADFRLRPCFVRVRGSSLLDQRRAAVLATARLSSGRSISTRTGRSLPRRRALHPCSSRFWIPPQYWTKWGATSQPRPEPRPCWKWHPPPGPPPRLRA